MGEEFIAKLSYEEKIVFLKAFCKLIKADGVIDEKELEFLKAVAGRYGLDKQEVLDVIHNISSVDCVKEASKITNRKHALQLIKELCLLANVDEDIHDKELDIIIDMAEAMGIEEDKIVKINRWVLNNIVLAKVGHVILEDEK